MKSDRFGINMKRFCREHEARVTAAAAAGEVTQELLEEHLRMIAWVQHERLMHLIVTVTVVLCELFTVDLVLLHPELGIVPAVIMLGLAVLLGFYFWHYFFLENTVQRWYRIAEEIQRQGRAGGKTEKDHLI
ncbi:MAG: hypothetical protein IJI45_05820 [Anaerolineaceae bacterium]|nr:hypothetical protein [Anaerolineaceae bacterium]